MSDAASSPLRISEAHWLQRPETQAVFAALAAQGFAARAVGGAVRNALLGEPVSEIDIATAALPEQVIAAAERAGLKAIPTGVEHGTVTVISGGAPYEITTLRRDVEPHGRHATVAFTGDWEADARRRDFTINALYCSADGDVFDPLGGYADLQARRIRFIGDPAERIREDYLRILRFFRLTATFAAGPPDAAGMAACVRERYGLTILSPERVRQEFLRLLGSPRAVGIADAMHDHGLLSFVLGAAPRPAILARLAAIQAVLGLEPDPALRLAALVVEVSDDAERMRERLRLSNEETATLLRAADHSPGISPTSPESAARAVLYRLDAHPYRQRVLLEWARSGDPPGSNAWRRRYQMPDAWRPPAFPITGTDVIALGVPAGPRVGEILRALENWWIAGDFASDDGLRNKLKELVSDARNA
jgi:poly(A) polymerase